jgi:hypothetical protein
MLANFRFRTYYLIQSCVRLLPEMRWRQIDTMTCSVARTLSMVGDRWTMLIIRDVFLGIRRFDAIQEDLHLTSHRLHPPRFDIGSRKKDSTCIH